MKSLIRKFFQRFGLDIVKYNPQYSSEYSLVQLLKHFNISLFLDVGANTGQTGEALLKNGYNKKIISFEPLSKAHKALLKKSQKYKNWQIAERVALGNKNGLTQINVSQNLQSSSILPMEKVHLQADPASKFIAREKIKVTKLDTLWAKYIKKKEKVFLKIDAQGYEEKILDGAKKSLSKIKGLQIELSLVSLYKGEPLFEEMLKKIEKRGFKLYQLYPGFTNKKTGQLFQVDCIFFRPKTKTK